MHSHASQRTRSCFDVVRQVASMAVKEEGRKRKKKKKKKKKIKKERKRRIECSPTSSGGHICDVDRGQCPGCRECDAEDLANEAM